MQSSVNTTKLSRRVAKRMASQMARSNGRVWKIRSGGSFTPGADRAGEFTVETRKRKRVLKEL